MSNKAKLLMKRLARSRLMSPYISLLRRMRTKSRISVVLYPSFECNYSCPYCVLRRSSYFEIYPKEVEHSWEDWADVLSKFPPAIIGISGGEPLLSKGLIPLINNLATKHNVFLTTNLSQPLGEFLNLATKSVGISASFHPYMIDIDSFNGKVQELIQEGFSVSVEVVAYAPLINKLKDFRAFFETEAGVMLNIDPDVSPDYRYTEAEIKALKRLGMRNRRLGFDFDGYGKLKQCTAGSKHFIMVPNGDVYACHAGFYYVTSPLYEEFSSPKEEFYLGNLFDGSFKLLAGSKICAMPCSEGCDLDGASVKEVKGISRPNLIPSGGK